jgi:NADPH:quinone reductase-like Zn-dependent oxidoreductase
MSNQSAWLDGIGQPLRVGESPMPEPKDDEISIRVRAAAVNPVDHVQQSTGWIIKEFPYILGQDVAGEVTAAGDQVQDLKIGDRVTAHLWTITTGSKTEAGFALYAKVLAQNAARIPDEVSFASGSVIPLSIDTAISGMYAPRGILDLPLPTLAAEQTGKVLLVYGGSSSIGLAVTQLAAASGLRVITTASPHNHAVSAKAGANTTLDYRSSDLVEKVIEAVGDDDFVGIYDAVSLESTFAHDLAILKHFGGGKLVSVLEPPKDLPENVQTQFVFGIGKDLLHVWDSYVKEAVSSNKFKFLPEPLVIGQGLESVQKGIDHIAKGVSATKVVIEL